MDRMDRTILKHLQNDSSLSHSELVQCVHFSSSRVLPRIQRFHNEGLTASQVALLDEQKLGLPRRHVVTGFSS